MVYYEASGLRTEAWGLISLSGVIAILAGVLINRPAHKVPWFLLAAALACFAAGQLSFLIAARLGVVLPFPSFADVLYLSEYPLAAAALLIFIYWRSPDGDRRSLIDALTLTAGLALLSWTFLIRPYVHNPDCPGCRRASRSPTRSATCSMLALLARLLAPGAAGPGASSSSPWARSPACCPTWPSAICSCTGRSITARSSTSAGRCSTAPGAPRRCTRA